MAEMRHRNQVVVYSDHMNAYHAQMEELINKGPTLVEKPDGIFQLTAQAGALGYLADRLKTEAPSAYAADAAFTTLRKAVDDSVGALKAALRSQDRARVREALGKLKGPYSKMFIKFG